MPLQETSGTASYDAFGGGAPVEPNYIESVFSTFLYTGNGSTQTITNGIDLSGKGGLVWAKARSIAYPNFLIDTVRGRAYPLRSDAADAASTSLAGYDLTSFNSNGFSLGTDWVAPINTSNDTFASWTFREQPKFFDIVTYTGTGSNTTIAHNLGAVPGAIWVKRTDATANWQCYHRSLANTEYMVLNSTAAVATGATRWNSTTPTSAVFSIGTDSTVNASGGTYVAYLFAHNAGGFGLTGTDNVISCGSFTTDGSGNATVDLGYEPQWVLMKSSSSSSSNWILADTMRGWTVDGAGGNANRQLYANTSDAEAGGTPANLNSTGFTFKSSYSGYFSTTFIYIAIRRGPMKVPTDGTKVFQAVSFSSSASNQTIDPGITTDLCLLDFRNIANGFEWFDRLRGITGTTGSGNKMLTSASTAAEANSTEINGAGQTTLVAGGTLGGYTQIVECFRRAPSFFDEVCYTGNRVSGSTTQTLTHNLGVAPELMIVKGRSSAFSWFVYSATLGATQNLILQSTAGAASAANPNGYWNETAPTSTQFTVGANNNINGSGVTFVAYLFATCAGVSKVGSYTGTGATQTISCGFTGGARFVLIKRTDSTGDWYVWDTARGMVSGTDPSLLLNSTAAEVNANSIYTTTGGFQIVSTAAGINASGGSYIYFSVA